MTAASRSPGTSVGLQAIGSSDPRGDPRGRNVLDIASVWLIEHRGRVSFGLTTFDRWSPATLGDDGEVSFRIDTNGDRRIDRRVEVRWMRGALVALVVDGDGRFVGRGAAVKKAPHMLAGRFRRSLLGPSAHRNRWYVWTGYLCPNTSGSCGDRAPQRGWLMLEPARPAPIAGQGYKVSFQDEFTSFDQNTWARRQWWEPNSPSGSIYVDPSGSGTLQVVSKRADGYPNVTASSEPHGSGTGRSFQYGYLEARMRWTGAKGSGPAFWLFSTTHATNPKWPQPACPGPECLSGEIDVFEGYGHKPNVFTGTIHRNSCGCYSTPDRINSNNWQPQSFDLSRDWHTYAALWTQTTVSWYLDDRLIMSAPAFDSLNQRMHLLFYNWRTPWESGNDPDPTTPNELRTEVDWVRVWQK